MRQNLTMIKLCFDFSKIAGAVYSKTKIFKRLESIIKQEYNEIIGRKTNNKFFP